MMDAERQYCRAMTATGLRPCATWLAQLWAGIARLNGHAVRAQNRPSRMHARITVRGIISLGECVSSAAVVITPNPTNVSNAKTSPLNRPRCPFRDRTGSNGRKSTCPRLAKTPKIVPANASSTVSSQIIRIMDPLAEIWAPGYANRATIAVETSTPASQVPYPVRMLNRELSRSLKNNPNRMGWSTTAKKYIAATNVPIHIPISGLSESESQVYALPADGISREI